MTSQGAFLQAAAVAVDLIGTPQVAARWADPSALPQMSVGALAQHLGSQIVSAHAAAQDSAYAGDGRPVSLVEHYRRAAWVEAGVDDEANVSIREGAEQAASDGYVAVLARVESSLAGLQPWPPDAPAVVRMPWWGWCLSEEDFLVTRMMELMVHADDLAVSVGIATPVFPPRVSRRVLALLTSVAEDRYGQAEVVRALTRSERAPGSIVVF